MGLDDDFFALGGNSLLAAEMLAHTRAIFGISADSVRPLTRCLLRDPTLRGFSAAAADARAGRLAADGDQAEVDFARETRLNLKIRLDGAPSHPRPDWRSPREVLLTGATGFLGAHLLSELLATTDARVHCLVRARDDAAALSRIRQAADRYELAVPSADRVVPLAGDLAEPRLGLSDTAFRDLAHRIDVIYHAGALVNFIYPYQELRAANVAGTREVIRLAGLYRGIPVHYVSTTAVLAGLGVAGTREVTEETPLANPELLRMGYVETKYVAEELLRAAGRAGLPVAIYRPLDIVGSVRHRRLEHLDRDGRADQVHRRHRPGARHRPAARLRGRRRLRGGHPFISPSPRVRRDAPTISPARRTRRSVSWSPGCG